MQHRPHVSQQGWRVKSNDVTLVFVQGGRKKLTLMKSVHELMRTDTVFHPEKQFTGWFRRHRTERSRSCTETLCIDWLIDWSDVGSPLWAVSKCRPRQTGRGCFGRTRSRLISPSLLLLWAFSPVSTSHLSSRCHNSSTLVRANTLKMRTIHAREMKCCNK